jgi:hypothetical protein
MFYRTPTRGYPLGAFTAVNGYGTSFKDKETPYKDIGGEIKLDGFYSGNTWVAKSKKNFILLHVAKRSGLKATGARLQ